MCAFGYIRVVGWLFSHMLVYHSVDGTIPSELSKLSKLSVLGLNDNDLGVCKYGCVCVNKGV